jgi:transposase InsO family protein
MSRVLRSRCRSAEPVRPFRHAARRITIVLGDPSRRPSESVPARFAETQKRYGYRRITMLLRREGWHVNVKRVHRLYRLEGLQMRLKPHADAFMAKLRDDASTMRGENARPATKPQSSTARLDRSCLEKAQRPGPKFLGCARWKKPSGPVQGWGSSSSGSRKLFGMVAAERRSLPRPIEANCALGDWALNRSSGFAARICACQATDDSLRVYTLTLT